MEGKLIRRFTEDGIELQGLFCRPAGHSSNQAILYVHGLAGNFYENRFIDYIEDAVRKQGYSFLTVNTRGHDYLADFLKQTCHRFSYVQIGGAHEIFEESEADIATWVGFLEEEGYAEVALGGHSFGAMKAVYYQYHRQDSRVKAMFLASPPDSVGLQKAAHQDRYDEFLELAQAYMEAGQGQELLPPDALEGYPIDAQTYLNFFGPMTRTGIFDFSAPDDFQELASLTAPILAFFGTVNEALVGDIRECLQLIRENARCAARCDTAVIEGAPHNYFCHEREVAQVITNWLKEVLPVG